MTRVLAILLLLAPAVLAQGMEDWIDEALDPKTGPSQRNHLLGRITKADGGLAQLAAKGLDGARDPEVVHAVVEAVFNSGDYAAHLQRICRLLLVAKHREKVLARIERIGEPADAGRILRDGLYRIAEGKMAENDPELRGAAVTALGRIPRREVFQLVVQLGLRDEEVRAAALAVVGEHGFPSLEDARRFLRENRNSSVYGLLRQRVKEQAEELEGLRNLQRRHLENANATEALAALEKGEVKGKLIASRRLRELAEAGDFKQLGPEQFAGRVFERFVAERDSPSRTATTLANLCGTLDILARAREGQQAPLFLAKSVEEVVAALEALAGGDSRFPDPQELQRVGSAAVRLLGTLGEPAAKALLGYAEKFGHTDMRQEAIQSLGALARRFEKSRDYVGRRLAGMLSQKMDPAVRNQVLSTLTQRFVPVGQALGPIRDYLQPKDPAQAPALNDAEFRDCIEILGQMGSDQALALLFEVSADHPILKVRRFAVEDGLLPWARRNGKEPGILAHVAQLATSAAQPLEARLTVVAALGLKGTRNARATLNRIARSDGIDPEVQTAIAEAKLRLAARLVSVGNGGTVAPEDLQTAVGILEEEKGTAAPERLEKLARDIVEAGDAAKLPVGVARFRRLSLYLQRPREQRDGAELLRLYEDAATKAAADGLPPKEERNLLQRYKDELLREETDPQRVDRAIWCLSRMAELTVGENQGEAARFLLDAAERAIALRERTQAQELLRRAARTGGLEGPLTQRHQSLSKLAQALPAPQ
ncbi:MAG: HEAT repeat domain-containing protein [Planctomycetota bacterium]|jgi:hypothetical protein